MACDCALAPSREPVAGSAPARATPIPLSNPILNLAGIVQDSIVDGPGIRCAIFAQGCSHACPGCHNPATHPFGIGVDIGVEEIVSLVRSNPLVSGVTLSGGDPFFQAEGFSVLAARLKRLGYEVAAYTGFTWESLLSSRDPSVQDLLRNLDILVDGPFSLAERDLSLRFRGSGNQRVIDVKKSFAADAARSDAVFAPILCAERRWVG